MTSKYPTINLPRATAIYQIVNTVNGWVYIGSTRDTESRLHTHLVELYRNKHTNSKLRQDANKYGPSVFIFSILETLPDSATEAEMFEREVYYTRQAHRHGKCYNPKDPRVRHGCPKRVCSICGGTHRSNWMCAQHLMEWQDFSQNVSKISSEDYIQLTKEHPQ